MFIDQLRSFKVQTKGSIKDLMESNLFLIKLYRIVNENLELFTEERVIIEIMEFFNSIVNLSKVQLSHSLDTFSLCNISYLMLAVFLGPVVDSVEPINKYLVLYGQEILPSFNEVDLQDVEHKEFFTLLLKNLVILKEVNMLSRVQEVVELRAIQDAAFRKLYMEVMNEIIKDMHHYEALRPELKAWYDRVKKNAEEYKNYILLKVEEVKIHSNTSLVQGKRIFK